jgi:hypothetical protein
MTIAIAWFLLGLTALGLLTAVALLIGFIATSRSDTDLYLSDYECDCYACSDIPPSDVCSSECDDECAARDHCDRSSNPWCSCNSCTQHNLDELPPKADNE